MYIYVAQDWNGNVYITDERDCLPPDITEFHTVYLKNLNSEHLSDDPILDILIADYSEQISINRQP